LKELLNIQCIKSILRGQKKYHAHDETNKLSIGDKVLIEETKPISKLKTWKVLDNEKSK
jgi:small subunit ribosomal protein S17